MALKKTICHLALTCLLILPPVLHAQEPVQIEPPHWWTSMPSNELTLVLHGKGIGSWTPTVREKSLRLKEILPCDHPDYLWINLNWDAVFKASTILIRLSHEGQIREIPYTFKARNRDFRPVGLQSSDALYVIHPDRFANGNPANDRAIPSLLKRRNPYARHGGDIDGIRQYLDYIKNLGASAVLLYSIEEAKGKQPAFPEQSISNHFAVDLRYGDTASYKRLVQRLHHMKMKVVKEVNYSFVAPEHDLIHNLPFPGWLTPEQQKRLDSEKTRIAWNTADPLLRDYLTQMTLWWMEEFQLDALCVDQYAVLDRSFADHLTHQVETAYPGVTIYADIPEDDPQTLSQSTRTRQHPQSGDPSLRHVVNYPLQQAVDHLFTDRDAAEGANGLEAILEGDEYYVDPGRNINFLDDRRTTRWFGRQDCDLDKFKAGLAILATARGIPAIYYGTEILMKQTKNPGKVSEDFPGGWPRDRRNKFTDRGRKKKEKEAFRTIQRYLTWRSNNLAVTRGTLVSYPLQGYVHTYFRRYGENLVMVVINGDQRKQEYTLDAFRDTIRGYVTARDVLTGEIYALADLWTLDGWESRVLELER